MKCIFLDIDGTLLDHEVGILESSKIAIKEARANGHKVCLATGRAKPEVAQDLLDLGFDGFIFSCGSYVETRDTLLFQEVMNKKDIADVIKLLQKNHVGFNLEGIRDSFLDETGFSFFHDLFKNEMDMNSELARQYMASVHMLPYQQFQDKDYEQILKIAIFAKEQNACRIVQENLSSHLKLTLHGVDENPIINGEITCAHISKATGMNILLDYFHIPVCDTIAIGDSMNDVDMILHAHCGVAMANANKELIRLSDEQTTSSKEDGIYHCFKKHGII
ncbi:MAG: HAD family hydrolase [Longicatena sp.]